MARCSDSFGNICRGTRTIGNKRSAIAISSHFQLIFECTASWKSGHLSSFGMCLVEFTKASPCFQALAGGSLGDDALRLFLKFLGFAMMFVPAVALITNSTSIVKPRLLNSVQYDGRKISTKVKVRRQYLCVDWVKGVGLVEFAAKFGTRYELDWFLVVWHRQ